MHFSWFDFSWLYFILTHTFKGSVRHGLYLKSCANHIEFISNDEEYLLNRNSSLIQSHRLDSCWFFISLFSVQNKCLMKPRPIRKDSRDQHTFWIRNVIKQIMHFAVIYLCIALYICWLISLHEILLLRMLGFRI